MDFKFSTGLGGYWYLIEVQLAFTSDEQIIERSCTMSAYMI